MSSIFRFVLASFALAIALSACADKTIPPVMILLTSHGQMGELDRETGYFVPEAAHPWKVFTEAGIPFEFVSVAGGRPPHDGLDLTDPVQKEFWENADVQAALGATRKVAAVKAADYSAVLVVGGHGTMWDLPDNKDVQKLLANVYESEGVVSAVCHGPAALINVRLSDDSYLVSGRNVAAFTNEEEAAVELTETVPFLLESALVKRGAVMQKAANWQPSVVADGRLITGQNPASAEGVARAIVQELMKN
ncbi:MAG: type 1 glutamine amidotransferase domain-containing protein [Gemmatimonadetes bacterium]|nr:type 1 glutamine amidotransferase domain-containing protein [Gemmatimonadota bacterium]